jgi:predicted ArsR family transcriptional regulator
MMRRRTVEPELPEEIVRFILNRIDSVPHMEALLLLWETPEKAWTEAEIAARVYVSVDVARVILQDLVGRKLAAVRAESGAGYRYDSAWDPTGEEMAAVARTYRQQLVRVASLIHSKGSPALRDFARAFQFKSGK